MKIRRNHIYLSAAAVAVAIALPFLPARAQENVPPEGPNSPREERRMDMWEELGLTDEQLQEIRSLREAMRADHQERRQELRSEQEQLETLLAGTASDGEVRSQFERVQGMRQDLATSHFDSIMAMREILEPDQRSLLVEHLGRRRQGRRGHRGHRRGDRQAEGLPGGREAAPPVEQDL